jgi:dihydrofolate synthase/folylpolyglutamate synthase
VNLAEEADPRFRAALDALAARGRFGIRLGLGRTRALLRSLGDPQQGLPGVLIGGTNGKGSVQALVAGALQQGGYRVGQTPKPHLVSYRERIVVDGMPIAALDFADLAEEVIGHADRVAPRLGPPTEFELLTAAAFTWFHRQAVDTAVVEVGMGGRLDATNVWQGGVSAITNVALDHTEHLGPTILHIAREKAPIVKRGDRAAVTGTEGAALAIITRRARRLGVPLRVVKTLPVAAFDRSGLLVELSGGTMRVGLLGRHQAANAAIALAILDELAAAGIAQVGSRDVERAFAQVRWPGRLELLSLAADDTAHAASVDGPHRSQPDVLLDGAHNAHGAQALAAALEELRPLLSPGRPTLLMGVLADKDVSGMVAPLAACRALDGARVVATSVPDAPRSLPPAGLAEVWKTATHGAGDRRDSSARAIDEPGDALSQAIEYSRQAEGPLIVCGSLYLVGFVRGRLVADTRASGPL